MPVKVQAGDCWFDEEKLRGGWAPPGGWLWLDPLAGAAFIRHKDLDQVVSDAARVRAALHVGPSDRDSIRREVLQQNLTRCIQRGITDAIRCRSGVDLAALVRAGKCPVCGG